MRGTHTVAYRAKFAVKRRSVGRSARRAERDVQKNEAEIREMHQKNKEEKHMRFSWLESAWMPLFVRGVATRAKKSTVLN
jgi:hypothetical protein